MGSVGRASAVTLVDRARQETDPNRVLNSVDESELGANFQNLSYMNKSTIKSMLRLTKGDVNFLEEHGDKGNLSQAIKIGGSRYTVSIAFNNDRTDVLYTLKKGNKFIVNKGNYQNVANQLAVLMNRG